MNLEKLKQLTRAAEGDIAHFYLDGAGNVTVGVGHLVKNVAEALRLPLEPSYNIVKDFARVAAAEKGKVAAFYSPLCSTLLSVVDSETLLANDTALFVKELQEHLASFITWPDTVQEAVFDMAYNLGLGGFDKFVNLRVALDAKDWAACARRCHRVGISDARNKQTAALFQSAV